MSDLKYCVQCPFHERVADPDPDDWFDDDDEALLCIHPNCPVDDYTDLQREYYKKRGWIEKGRVITSSERPFNINKEKVPSYCPLVRTAIFVGGFDPFTVGHINIVERAIPLFDLIVIGVGVNPDKTYKYPMEERIEKIKSFFPDLKVEAYSDLTVDFAKRHGARYIVRGIRNEEDFRYELEFSDYNKDHGELETIWLPVTSKLRNISSTKIREEENDNRRESNRISEIS